MHDIKLIQDYRNEGGQTYKSGVLLRVQLAVAHDLVSRKIATAFTELPPLPPAPAPAAPVTPQPAPGV